MLEGKDYKKLIEEGGLRQSWIAKKIGVTPAMFSFFLNGKRRMRQEYITKLNKVLKERGVI